MEHSHFSFGKVIPCPKPKTCPLAVMPADKPKASKKAWKKPEGTISDPADWKLEAELREKNHAKFKGKPMPQRPAKAVRYRRTGGTVTSKGPDNVLDSRWDF